MRCRLINLSDQLVGTADIPRNVTYVVVPGGHGNDVMYVRSDPEDEFHETTGTARILQPVAIQYAEQD